MYKYNRTIRDGAEKLIDGIENIEMFLEDNETFHDCGIHSFSWNSETKELTLTIEPLTYRFFAGEYGNMLPLLDFHFVNCLSIETYMETGIAIIDEMVISKGNNYLQCELGQVCITIQSIRLRVDKPRFVPLEEESSPIG